MVARHRYIRDVGQHAAGEIDAPAGASVEAAVAAATRTALLNLLPAEQAAIEADYQAELKLLPDGSAKANGISVGEKAAAAIRAVQALPDYLADRLAVGR